MKTLRFGIEIETVGLTREAVAKAIAKALGGTAERDPANYDSWLARDAAGRSWRAVYDGSLTLPNESAEIVSPILTWDDLPKLQEIVRAVRHAGAKVDASCGIHVHVDAARFDAKTLGNLARLVNQQEDLLIAALKIQPARLMRYTKPMDQGFLRRLNEERPQTMAAFNRVWYGREQTRPSHYHDSRYHGLNLHSVWYRGTIEFRYFEGTLHAGKVKSYVQLCLALAAKALSARFALSRKRTVDAAHAKYDFRVFLLRLGLIGEEFATARYHLLANLEGSGAFRNSARPQRSATAAPAAPDAGEDR